MGEEVGIALQEDLPSDVTLRQLFSSKPPLFVIWKPDKEQRGASSQREQSGYSSPMRWGANEKDACVVKGWKGIKKQRNKQRNKKAGA